jgi:hypothetical protein
VGRSVGNQRDLWRLALRLSMTAAVGGALLLVVGAMVAAWITFGFGVLCAGAAGLLIRHDENQSRPSR